MTCNEAASISISSFWASFGRWLIAGVKVESYVVPLSGRKVFILEPLSNVCCELYLMLKYTYPVSALVMDESYV